MFGKKQHEDLSTGDVHPSASAIDSIHLPSFIADELSIQFETRTVPETETTKMVHDMESLLTTDSVQTKVDGERVTASRLSYPQKIGNVTTHVRVVRRDRSVDLPEYSLAFDESGTFPIKTSSPDILRYVDMGDGQYVLASGTRTGQTIDEVGMLTFTQGVVGAIQLASNKDLSSRRSDQETQAWRRKHRAKTIAKRIAAVSLTAGLLSGGAYGVQTGIRYGLFDSFDESYDRHNYTLPIGNTAVMGQTIAPSFSDQLVQQSKNTITDAPILYKDGDDGNYADDSLTVDDGIRQIILTSSQTEEKLLSRYVRTNTAAQ